MLTAIFSTDALPTGRIDPLMLADQQIMEIFFTPNSLTQAHKALGGDEYDACTWNGVQCFQDDIVEIVWQEIDVKLEGTLDFHILPPELYALNIKNKKIVGDLDTSNLPRKLESFRIIETGMTGILDMSNLPRALMVFAVEKNRISDVGPICNIPETLCQLRIVELGLEDALIRIDKIPDRTRVHLLTGCDTNVKLADERDLAKLSTERRHMRKPGKH